MGKATIYAKTHLRTRLNRKYGITLSEFLIGFLGDKHTQYVWKSNSNVSNSYLVGILQMMALTALRPLLRVSISTSHLGLRYLQMLPF